MNKYVSLDKRSKKAQRRSAKNSEMDLMPIFFCKTIYFLLDYDVT